MHPQDRLFCEIAVQLQLLTREQVQQCLHAQERDPRRNVAAIAVQLGFIAQTNVEAVMQQQQRVLDRRREARAASRAQREAESRAAAGLRPSAGRQSLVEPPPRKDPTPTSPWVHERRARLQSERPPTPVDEVELAEEHFGEDMDRVLATRETLDERPPQRASGRSHARELHGSPPQPSAASISGTRDTIEELPRAGWRESQPGGVVDREDETRAGRRSPSEELRLEAERRVGEDETAPADAVSGGPGEAEAPDAVSGGRGQLGDDTAPADVASHAHGAAAFGDVLGAADDAAPRGFRASVAEGRDDIARGSAHDARAQAGQGDGSRVGRDSRADVGQGDALRADRDSRAEVGHADALLRAGRDSRVQPEVADGAHAARGSIADDAARGARREPPSRPERGDPTRASGRREGRASDRDAAAARAREAANPDREAVPPPRRTRDSEPGIQALLERESAARRARDSNPGMQSPVARERARDSNPGAAQRARDSNPEAAQRARDSNPGAAQRARDSNPGMPAARPVVPPASRANESMVTRATMPMEKVSPPPPPAAGRAGRTPFRGELRSPPFLAAATSAPISRSMLPPLTNGPHGTLLESSGREQRLREIAERASKPQVRPQPAGRDWRNPSRPPPPMAAFDAEPVRLPPDAAMPGSTPRQLRAPPLDTPRYIDRLLELCQEHGASDLQLHAGAAPVARVDGKLWPLASDQRLTRAQAESSIGELLDDAQQLQIHVDGQLRFVYELPGGVRARGHAYLSEQGMHVALRLLPREVPQAERLGLGPALRALRETPHGLCVCSSPAGAGRTTSLFALTRGLIAERALHVVSIEDPIELLHDGALGLVEQRELGQHVASYAEGVTWALRQSVDVIVISDVLAPGALEACLQACRARCLVLAGMRASNAGSALARLIHGSANPELTRIELAHGLRLLLQQRLLPKARVPGRVAAIEQVVNTPQIAQLIRDDKLQQLPAVMSASKSAGMALLDDALDELVRVGTITPEVAQKAARRSDRFKPAASAG